MVNGSTELPFREEFPVGEDCCFENGEKMDELVVGSSRPWEALIPSTAREETPTGGLPLNELDELELENGEFDFMTDLPIYS